MHNKLIGKIVRISGNAYVVDTANGEFLCKVRGRLKKVYSKVKSLVSIGDNVEIIYSYGNEGMIESVLERRNKISRPHPYYNDVEQVMAVNVDKMVIVQSFKEPEFDSHIIDRCLVIAHSNDVEPVLCFNKSDLIEKDAENMSNMYRAVGYKTAVVSANNGDGIDTLKTLLDGSISALVGMSGVGKSAIVNAIKPGLNLKTCAVSEKLKKGRHTTTWSQIIKLWENTYIIDMPGIEIFGLWNVSKQEIALYFPEIAALYGRCKFSNCWHRNEPDCKVIQAVNEGAIHPARYKSYLAMLD